MGVIVKVGLKLIGKKELKNSKNLLELCYTNEWAFFVI